MELLVTLLACYGLYSFWKRIILPRLRRHPLAQERGLLAVKAALYLLMTEQGEMPQEANAMLSTYNTENMPIQFITAAQDYMAVRYSGQHLMAISDARNKGFMG